MSSLTMATEIVSKEIESSDWFSEPPRHEVSDTLPKWYLDLQDEAWKTFLDTPAPSRMQEEWRFADLKKTRFAHLSISEPLADTSALLARAKENLLEDYSAHFVFANNRLVHFENRSLPAEVICLPVNEALSRHGDLMKQHFLRDGETVGGAKFAALHSSATLSGIFVYAAGGVTVEHPILVHHFAEGELAPVYPHTLIVAEDNSAVSVMETFESVVEGRQTLVIGMADLAASNGGNIQYVSFQDESDEGAKHVQLNHTRVGKDALVRSAFLNLGAAWVRNESITRMIESGAQSEILSATLATGLQEYDQRTLQSHEAQHTNSDLLFKNALYDEARTIFGGLIQVQPGAHYTDSFQTCRNLLGSDTAEANSMPGLEIDADQVKCSHGATSGQISDEEIFYLCARGISPEVARQMISFGFLNEVVQRLDGTQLQEYLSGKIEEKFVELLK